VFDQQGVLRKCQIIEYHWDTTEYNHPVIRKTVVFVAIANATNTFEKLMMVVGEMKGEKGLAVKGDMQAKQRFEASKKCCQLFFLRVHG
jgi:hypothetical protein